MKTGKSYNVKIKFKLTEDELKEVQKIQSKGKVSARIVRRARILELFNKGLTSPAIAKYTGATAETVRRVGNHYIIGGLKRALYDAPRPGKERLLSASQEEMIVAIVCSEPPEGYARWSTSLLKKEVIKRKIILSVGDETIRQVLKRHKLKPWREKNVVRSGADS
jgi:putative transposase